MTYSTLVELHTYLCILLMFSSLTDAGNILFIYLLVFIGLHLQAAMGWLYFSIL